MTDRTELAAELKRLSNKIMPLGEDWGADLKLLDRAIEALSAPSNQSIPQRKNNEFAENIG